MAREGRHNPEPLRFPDVEGMREYIRANKLKVSERIRTSRGVRVQVVDPKGKPHTLSVERRNGATEDAK